MSIERLDRTSPHVNVLAVDVCGTLYRANTTAGYVRFCLAALDKPGWLGLLSVLSNKALPFRPLLIGLGKLLRADLLKLLHLRSLAGISKPALRTLAIEYVRTLAPLKIDAVFDKIENLRAVGWNLVLASNSVDIVIEQIAETLHVPFVASTMSFDGAVFSGRISQDLRGKKLGAVRKFAEQFHQPTEFGIITDNKSDIDLIRASQLVVLVCAPSETNWSEREDAQIIHK